MFIITYMFVCMSVWVRVLIINAYTCANSYRPNIPVESVLKQLGLATVDSWSEFSQQLPITYDDSKSKIDCKTSVANITNWWMNRKWDINWEKAVLQLSKMLRRQVATLYYSSWVFSRSAGALAIRMWQKLLDQHFSGPSKNAHYPSYFWVGWAWIEEKADHPDVWWSKCFFGWNGNGLKFILVFVELCTYNLELVERPSIRTLFTSIHLLSAVESCRVAWLTSWETFSSIVGTSDYWWQTFIFVRYFFRVSNFVTLLKNKYLFIWSILPLSRSCFYVFHLQIISLPNFTF